MIFEVWDKEAKCIVVEIEGVNTKQEAGKAYREYSGIPMSIIRARFLIYEKGKTPSWRKETGKGKTTRTIKERSR